MPRTIILLLALLWACTKDDENNLEGAPDLLAIKSGTAFGLCMGYCVKVADITPQEIKYAQHPSHGTLLPIKECSIPITRQAWNHLSALVDERFFGLDTIQGCPDCVDQGREFIEVVLRDRRHKVTFEPELGLELHPLTKALREHRAEAHSSAPCQ